MPYGAAQMALDKQSQQMIYFNFNWRFRILMQTAVIVIINCFHEALEARR